MTNSTQWKSSQTIYAHWKLPYSLTNLVKNPSFEGSTNWSNLTDTTPVTGVKRSGSYSMRFGQATTNGIHTMSTQTFGTPILNHKYYGRIYWYSTTAAKISMRYEVFLGDAQGANLLLFTYGGNVPANTWTAFSGIKSITTSTYLNQTWTIRNFTYSTSTYGTYVYADDAMIIDLTAAFGAGNEPDVSWCDSNIPYFASTQTVYKVPS